MIRYISIRPRFAAMVLGLIAVVALLLPVSPTVYATTASTLALDGTGYLRIPNAPALNPVGGITIEAWVRRASADRCETIIGKNVNSSYWLGFCNGSIRFFTNGVDSWRDGNRAVAAGVWTHVAVTFDGTTRRYYLDGMLDFAADTPGLLPVNGEPLAIGADADETYPFSGNLADVRLWRTARTQQDIRRNMVQLLDRAHPDLVAAWHLEGSSTDIFGRYNALPVGTVTFTGPAAPPVPHEPILISQLADAPTVDGLCNIGAGEYRDLRLPIWYGASWAVENLAWSYVGATATDIYVCMREIPLETAASAVYLDSNGSGDSLPQNDDYVFLARSDGTVRTSQGNGAGGYSPFTLPTNAYAGRLLIGEVNATAEFRIARSLLAEPDAIFRLQFMQFHSGATLPGESGWPLDFDSATPTRWPRFRIAPVTVFVPDSDNPIIAVRHAPQPTIRRTDQVTINASASDMVDLASIDIYVDASTPVRSCTFDLLTDTSGVCEYLATLSLGRHMYYAIATDHRGRRTESTRTAIFVQADGQAPQLTMEHTPREPNTSENFTISATASDGSGIRSITIQTDSPPYERHVCTYTTTNLRATCTLTITPGVRRIIRYTIVAVDNEGLTTLSPPIPVLLGNRVSASTPDSDGDGIIDPLERALGTSATNLDSDFDALQDGWEVLGIAFPGSIDPPIFSDFINLPAMGANPRIKDVFVQYDYERGSRVEPMVWPYIIGRFRDHRITLHVSENERPRLGTYAELAASQLDPATGQFYFPPKLNWTHHYVYSKHSGDRSSGWHYTRINVFTNDCPLASSDPQSDPLCGPRDGNAQLYAVMHELGHDLGLGHGGHKADRARLLDQGDTISYGLVRGGGWDDTNLKPTYASIMNYRYNDLALCYNPAIGWLSLPDYGSGRLPSLNEGFLAEHAGSLFPQTLAAQGCIGATANYTPTVAYTCVDPNNIRWAIYSNGSQAVARARQGSDWVTSGLPTLSPPGIDWNCDGMISDGFVAENLNGDGGENGWGDGAANEVLTDYPDWENLPFGAGAGCVIVRERPSEFPARYRDRIANADCRVRTPALSATGASLNAKAASVPHVHAVDPEAAPPNTEFCNLIDDDNDQQIDEGCNDADGDGAVDLLDSCPQTPNADQTDQNNNYLGDSCEYPVVSALTAIQTVTGSVILGWTAPISDVLGFALYRQQLDGDGSAELLGAGYQPATSTHYIDAPANTGRYRYTVRAVNLIGLEGEEASVEIGQTPINIQRNFLPLILR